MSLYTTCHKCGRQTTMSRCPGCKHWVQGCKRCEGPRKKEPKGKRHGR